MAEALDQKSWTRRAACREMSELLQTDSVFKVIWDSRERLVEHGLEQLYPFLSRDSLVYFYWYMVNNVLDQLPDTHDLLNTNAIAYALANKKLIPLSVAFRVFSETHMLAKERQRARTQHS